MLGTSGTPWYYSLIANATHSTSATGNQATFHVAGTLSTISFTVDGGSFGDTVSFTLQKNGVADGSCAVGALFTNCAITPTTATFRDGDTVNIMQTDSTGTMSATWTATYTYGTPVVSLRDRLAQDAGGS